MFHHFAIGESYAASYGLDVKNNPLINPAATWRTAKDLVSYYKKLQKDPSDAMDWIEYGLHVDLAERTSPDVNLHSVDGIIQNLIQLSNKTALTRHSSTLALKGILKAKQKTDGFLWNVLHPTFKLHMAQRIYEEVSQDPRYLEKGVSEAQLKSDIAQYVNDALGGQEWEQYLWATPMAQDIMQTLVFAPDWTISALNVSGLPQVLKDITGVDNPLAKNRLNTGLPVDQQMAKYWPAFATIILVGAPIALQSMIYMLAGDPDEEDYPFPWQNEAGYELYIDITPIIRLLDRKHKLQGSTGHRRTYLKFGKQAYEIGRWGTHTVQSLLTKSSMASKVVLEQVLNKNSAWWDMPWVGKDDTGFFHVEGEFLPSRAGKIAEKFIPMSLLSVLQDRPSTFFAPTKQGTSKYVAVEKISKVLSMYADKDVDAQLNRYPDVRRSVERVVADYLEATRRNGYPPDVVLREALSKARGRHNLTIYQELRSGDPSDKVIQEEAEKLQRLQSRLSKNLFRSLETQFDAGNRFFDPKFRQEVVRAWHRARKGNAGPEA